MANHQNREIQPPRCYDSSRTTGLIGAIPERDRKPSSWPISLFLTRGRPCPRDSVGPTTLVAEANSLSPTARWGTFSPFMHFPWIPRGGLRVRSLPPAPRLRFHLVRAVRKNAGATTRVAPTRIGTCPGDKNGYRNLVMGFVLFTGFAGRKACCHPSWRLFPLAGGYHADGRR